MLVLITLVIFSFLTTIPHEAVAAEVLLTGSKTFEITDYSIMIKGTSNGSLIRSDAFTVGRYQWLIDFYPKGSIQDDFDYISIFVRLINTADVVRAVFTHRLLEWNTSTWSTNTPATFELYTFQPNNAALGYRTFMKRSDLEASNYLRNDTILFKTTLWVVNSTFPVLLPLPSTNLPVDVSSII